MNQIYKSAELNTKEPFDWDSIEITEDEFYKRAFRVSHEKTCEICGKMFIDHPMENRLLGYDKEPFLHRLCDGRLGKL